MIENNIKSIKNNIEIACKNSNRNIDDIKIIAATKTIDINRMKELKNLNINDFGENKAQELLEKYDMIDNINWHFIGNLQTNKVRHIIDKATLIHSVSSLKLIREIDKRAKAINKNMEILLEINIADDITKTGINIQNVPNILRELTNFPNITLVGLMCIAPFVENSEKNRQFFIKMHNLFVDIRGKNVDNINIEHLSNINMKYLSMGMTNDYTVAIEEGANMVRLGRAIFGERNY